MNLRTLLIALCAVVSISLFAQKSETKQDKNGNSYLSYSNDPTNSRWYTLDNGLTVVLSQNSAKPRVQTLIATKAGVAVIHQTIQDLRTIWSICFLKVRINLVA